MRALTQPLFASPQPAARSPWVAVGVTLVGSYAPVLNMTVMGVALPSIGQDLGRAGLVSADWVITGFLLGVVLILPATGWLADWLGRKTVYVLSLALFGLASIACVLAPTMEVLVVSRFIQGLGGGALMPIGMAIVYEAFPPHRRGSALGVWSVAIMAGPAAGPPLGGWLVAAMSWRWLFGVFVGVAVVGALLAARSLPDVGHREARSFDLVGWLLAAFGVTVALIGFRQVGEWGASPRTVGAAVLSLVALAVLVHRSLRRPEPIIEFRIFTSTTFAIAMVVLCFQSITQFAQLNFLPIELQVVRGMEAQSAGTVLVPAAIGAALMMPVGGWLVDRVGPRIPVTVGLSLIATSMWRLAHLRPDDSRMSVLLTLLVQGIGMGLGLVPATVTALSSLPGRLVAQASAVSNLNRQLAGAAGVAVLSAVIVADLGAVAPADPVIEHAQAAYNRVFLIAFWLAVLAATAGALLPGRVRARQDRADRAAELVGI